MIKFLLLLERNAYDDYIDDMRSIDEYIAALDQKSKNEYIAKRDELFKKYTTPDEFAKFKKIDDKIMSDIKQEYQNDEFEYRSHIMHKVANALTPSEKIYYDSIQKKYINSPKILGKLNRIKTKAYSKGYTDTTGEAGDINAKFLYHFTTGNSAISIIEDDMLYAYGENPWISFTTNKNLLKRGVVFYYASEDYAGRGSSNLSVGFVFDFNKIKSTIPVEKIKQGNADKYGTYYGEEEILIKEEEIPVKKYLDKILIYKNKIKETELIQLIKLCDKNNIKYFII